MVNYVGNWIRILRMKENGYFWILKGGVDHCINWFAEGTLTTRSLNKARGETSNTISRFLMPIKLLSYIVIIFVEIHSLILCATMENK
jgi:hypothetical protein